VRIHLFRPFTPNPSLGQTLVLGHVIQLILTAPQDTVSLLLVVPVVCWVQGESGGSEKASAPQRDTCYLCSDRMVCKMSRPEGNFSPHVLKTRSPNLLSPSLRSLSLLLSPSLHPAPHPPLPNHLSLRLPPPRLIQNLNPALPPRHRSRDLWRSEDIGEVVDPLPLLLQLLLHLFRIWVLRFRDQG
jgi:hypothetical protein